MANESPIQVWQKSPNNFRLDFTGFKDVLRHKLCKGIITDFKVTKYDPFTVESLVKVKLEDAEIDPAYGDQYIPLFYRPKEGYWDDDWNNIKAEDFDEENKCFRMAWMSFRCDDEVVVLTEVTDHQPKRGKPKVKPICVLGFYDNYPRIGEDVVKVERAEPEPPDVMPIEYGRMSQGRDLNTNGWWDFPDGKGPDGLPLNLLKKAESIKSKKYRWRDQYAPRWYRPRTLVGLRGKYIFESYDSTRIIPIEELCIFWCPSPDDSPHCTGICVFGGYCSLAAQHMVIGVLVVEEYIDWLVCMAHLLPVGPILYVVLSIWVTDSYKRMGNTGGVMKCADLKGWLETFQEGMDEPWDAPNTPFTMTPPPFQIIQNQIIRTYESSNKEDLVYAVQINAALYTKERYEQAKNIKLDPKVTWDKLWSKPMGRMVNLFPYVDRQFHWQSYPWVNMDPYDPYHASFWDNIVYHMRDRLMIRPHTKEELQECGLWPAFGPEG